MKTETKYAIKKDGKYLSGLFPDARFDEPTPDNSYLYRLKLIAGDIAIQLDAEVVTVTSHDQN